MIDDSWVPRVWNPMFGFFSFISKMQPFMLDAAPWEVAYAEGYTPGKKPAVPASPAPPPIPETTPAAANDK
jgi:hypothetical protein